MTRPISITMFCPQFRPIVGGAERQIEKLSKALVEKGCSVTVLTPRLFDGSPFLESDGGVEIRRFKLHDICLLLPRMRGLGPVNLFYLRHQVAKVVSSFAKHTDVFHAHIAAPLSIFAVEAARVAAVPTLCQIAAAGKGADLLQVRRNGVGGNVLARVLLRDTDCFIAMTGAIRTDLLSSGVCDSRIARVPNGVEIPAAAPSKERRCRFLYLGRISKNANRDVPTLLRAFDELTTFHPSAELALVGNGDLFKEVAALVSNLSAAPRIYMPGTQPPDRWLEWADYFVLPSRIEGLSNALLEAMAHRLPCIANDIPPNREVLDSGRCGVLVPIGDERVLLESMKGLIENRSAAEKLAEQAYRRVVEVYSMESVASQHMANYQTLLGMKERREKA